MKVVGLGAPCDVRIRFEACEVDVLVDVLREHRADATRDAAATYATASPATRAVDDRHDRLRTLEALLMQLEEQPQTGSGAILVGETSLTRDVVRDGAREALRRLDDAHQRYADHANPQTREALLLAAMTAKASVTTLTALDQVDQGWNA